MTVPEPDQYALAVAGALGLSVFGDAAAEPPGAESVLKRGSCE